MTIVKSLANTKIQIQSKIPVSKIKVRCYDPKAVLIDDLQLISKTLVNDLLTINFFDRYKNIKIMIKIKLTAIKY